MFPSVICPGEASIIPKEHVQGIGWINPERVGINMRASSAVILKGLAPVNLFKQLHTK
jgi:hypothetical protein